MDKFSKHVKLYPMIRQTLETIKRAMRRYFEEVNVPEKMVTDNAGQFKSSLWHKFAEEYGISTATTTSYNLQSNPVERVMRELGRITSTYASQNHTSWIGIIPQAERVINATTHSSTGYSPNELYYNEQGHLDLLETLIPEE
ncbi:uncharacterized protein LOC113005320 [Solenopsis invicta]|uniref:uncharacterized protein LOC113005320 n=1 Tax=Solenopsis invicta TaxID=13686 RepID=UPI000E33EB12|nr:uncharacterized protein LOC113005320 [Solenopsis invicta]